MNPLRFIDRPLGGGLRPGALGLIVLLSLAGCSADDRDSVILVIMDTTCSDRFGCTGHVAATTATLDSLAATGVRFADAVTATPVTGPAIATILSGVYPSVHGMRDNGMFELNPALVGLAHRFGDAGYQTAAVVGAVPLLASFGFSAGFDHYDDRFADDPYRVFDREFAAKEANLAKSERRADAVTRRALEWLRADAGQGPVFLVVHYYDPHSPPDPPPAYRTLHPDDPYDAEIAFMDAEIGRLLAGAREVIGPGRLKVIAVGDHGEGFFRHGEPDHGVFLYDTTMKVPLIFSGPGADAGRVVRNQVRTVDLAPTICRWVGIEPWVEVDGTDLSGALTGAPVPADCDTAYIETFYPQYSHRWSPLQGVRTAAFKWIRAPRQECYDLSGDPDETRNLMDRQPRAVPILESWHRKELASAVARAGRFGAKPIRLDPEVARQLASLGYTGTQGPGSLAADYSLPDPKDGMQERNQLLMWYQAWDDAGTLLEAGRPGAAVQLLDRAESLRPVSEEARAQCRRLITESRLQGMLQAAAVVADPDTKQRLLLHYADALWLVGRQSAAAAFIDSVHRAGDLPAPARRRWAEDQR